MTTIGASRSRTAGPARPVRVWQVAAVQQQRPRAPHDQQQRQEERDEQECGRVANRVLTSSCIPLTMKKIGTGTEADRWSFLTTSLSCPRTVPDDDSGPRRRPSRHTEAELKDDSVVLAMWHNGCPDRRLAPGGGDGADPGTLGGRGRDAGAAARRPRPRIRQQRGHRDLRPLNRVGPGARSARLTRTRPAALRTPWPGFRNGRWTGRSSAESATVCREG